MTLCQTVDNICSELILRWVRRPGVAWHWPVPPVSFMLVPPPLRPTSYIHTPRHSGLLTVSWINRALSCFRAFAYAVKNTLLPLFLWPTLTHLSGLLNIAFSLSKYPAPPYPQITVRILMILLHYVIVIFSNPIYKCVFICLLIDLAFPSASSLQWGRIHACLFLTVYSKPGGKLWHE